MDRSDTETQPAQGGGIDEIAENAHWLVGMGEEGVDDLRNYLVVDPNLRKC